MPSKSEKRLALRALKQKAFEEKRAVAVQNILAAKAPTQTATPKVQKTPVAYKEGESRYPHFMCYAKNREDRNGSWSWGASREWHPEPGDAYIYGFLDGYKKKTWADIEAETTVKKGGRTDKRHKTYPLSAICQEARHRLVELKLDDHHETIFRFRMGNKRRLYGFIFGVTFETVWYDAEHLICPKKD